MFTLSPRQAVAQRIADRLGEDVDRVMHGKGKRFYRVVREQPMIVVDVHYQTYIVVNQDLFHSEDMAVQQIEKLLAA